MGSKRNEIHYLLSGYNEGLLELEVNKIAN
jgi:hypothetical protein